MPDLVIAPADVPEVLILVMAFVVALFGAMLR